MNKSYFSVNNWLVDIPSGSILHLTTGERKRLGEYQLKLLEVFIQNTGIILTREELTNLVWERRVIGSNSLPNAIHALRSALEDDGKQQRIIKTIPKKGYLLEAEYCCSIIKEESEIGENSDTFLPEGSLLTFPEQQIPHSTLPEHEDSAELLSAPTKIIEGQVTNLDSASPQVPVQQYRRLFIALVMVILAALIGCGGMWYFLEGRQNRLLIEEQESNVYSNIHIYQISPASSPDRNTEKLHGKLKDTLYQLNQMLKAQSVSMNIYYLSIDQTLNYTFSMEHRCDSKQLAMAIYHWRIDVPQLNNLILRETKRKLNEMAICASE
ncbi:transcriptional regulator [Enterobacteriaceae bacterium H20N1]|uniref:Transcriptional regulator n=1 Tax=Dryocola boscaweniae TaxID=2925397 RepID=A0A9X2W6L1_9ENTR|nr:transcriptional regulator [Dryocola boscaweniae]MCT4701551.1 transcriptional regulator [Dryocola boscaweniae]MCT4718720.1 transcriptional regulator [Dryocola boscaweniae]